MKRGSSNTDFAVEEPDTALCNICPVLVFVPINPDRHLYIHGITFGLRAQEEKQLPANRFFSKFMLVAISKDGTKLPFSDVNRFSGVQW
jgi:hypothetical protein